MLTKEELIRDYGMTEAEIEQLEADAALFAEGAWPEGKTTRIGRPRTFEDKPVNIAFKDTVETRRAIDKRAADLGISRSDYLRQLVRSDLATA